MVFNFPKSCLSLICKTTTQVAMSLQHQHQHQQIRSMSKYLSKAAAKRRPLTTKRATKGYYKGKGCTKEGTFSGRAGRFVVDRSLMLELMVPDLTDFKVRSSYFILLCLTSYFHGCNDIHQLMIKVSPLSYWKYSLKA